MPVEDDLGRCLRQLREKRESYTDSVVRGSASPANVPDGYMQMTGRIQAMDDAIEIVRKAFASWLPDDVKPQTPRRAVNYDE